MGSPPPFALWWMGCTLCTSGEWGPPFELWWMGSPLCISGEWGPPFALQVNGFPPFHFRWIGSPLFTWSAKGDPIHQSANGGPHSHEVQRGDPIHLKYKGGTPFIWSAKGGTCMVVSIKLKKLSNYFTMHLQNNFENKQQLHYMQRHAFSFLPENGNEWTASVDSTNRC